MTTTDLLAAFGFNDALLRMNLDGVSERESLVQPDDCQPCREHAAAVSYVTSQPAKLIPPKLL